MSSFLHNFTSYAQGVWAGIRQLKYFRLSYFRKVFSFMGRKEKIAIGLLFFIAFFNLIITSERFYYKHTVSAAAYGGIYTEGFIGQPIYVNPLLAHTDNDMALTKLVFSGLYKYDGNGKLVSDLAESMPTISADQKQYTVAIRKNVKWHNGKQLTAEDVVFTIQTLQDESFKSPLRSLWLSTTIEKIDDYTVRFTTKDISGPFLSNLTIPILPKFVWSKTQPENFLLSENNLKAIGSGPYSIKEIKKLGSGKIQEMSFQSFSNYYAGKPKLDTIVIKFYDTADDLINALHGKEIDGLGFSSLDTNLYIDKQDTNVASSRIPLPEYQVLFFNINNKILSDQSVRQALANATNKQAIIDSVFKGNATLPASPWLGPLATPEKNSFNLDNARQQLDAAGWKIDPKTGLRTKKGSPFTITIATNDSLVNSQAAQGVANQWKELGITVNLSVLTTKDLTKNLIRTRNYDVLLFPQKFGADADPFIFWHSSQVKDPGENITGFTDASADKLITEARTTTDTSLRQQKYEQFDTIFKQKVPAIFLDQSIYTYALDSTIQNVNIHSIYDISSRFYDVPNWFTEEKRIWK